MVNRLFVVSNAPKAGKLLVVLGLMELLTRRLGRVSFFRPVIEASERQDPDISLILSRYCPHQSYEEAFGLTADELKEQVAQGKAKEALSQLLDQIDALEEKSDFILFEGLNAQGFLAAFDRDINLTLAQNLGTSLVSVINGRDMDAEDLEQAIKITHSSAENKDLTHVAIFANRLPPETFASFQGREYLIEKTPVFFLPEVLELDRPTILDLVEHLQAEIILGQEQDLDRVIKQVKIASMTMEHFLDYLEEGDLIITAGDRADIILSSLVSLFSPHFPKISGLLLTGGLVPGPNVNKLLSTRTVPIPVLSIQEDTYSATERVNHVPATLSPKSERKLALALGTFEEHVASETIFKQIALTTSAVVTPLMFEHSLFERARKSRKRIVLPEAEDERVLRAAEIVLRRGVADVILLGQPEEIEVRTKALGLDLGQATFLNPEEVPFREEMAQTLYEVRRQKGLTLDAAHDLLNDVSYFGTMMVYLGHADGMVSGARHTTAETIRPALQIIKTKPGYKIVSSLFFMCLPTKVLVYADCAINLDPSAEELAEIALASAETAALFGLSPPRVALLSYSTGASGKGKDVEKVRRATEIVRKRRPDLLVEGPIQYDAAIDPEVAKIKLPGSPVAGEANVFIFPDLNAGNNAYKAVQRSAGAVAIGPILQGLKKPVNDLSRGALVRDIVNTIAITAIQAQEGEAP